MITGEQGAGTLACPVREGADGKGPGDRDLAGGLLHVMRGGWKRGMAASGQERPEGTLADAHRHRASLLLYQDDRKVLRTTGRVALDGYESSASSIQRSFSSARRIST